MTQKVTEVLWSFKYDYAIFQQPNPVTFFWWFSKDYLIFSSFFFSLRTVNIIQLLKWITYLIYFIHFMNMFFILHIIFGCQKNRKVFDKLYPFLLLYMYTATIFQTKVHNRFSAWFLSSSFFYNPTLFTHAYISTCTCI